MKECILNSAPKSCELDPIPSKLLVECLDYILPSLTDLFNSFLASSHNASNQLLSHLFSKRGVLITMIWTTIGLSIIYALLLKYWKNLSYPKFLPTSTLTIFTIHVNQHIVQVTALKQLFWKLLIICSFLLTKATYLYQPWQHLTQLIILSLYTISCFWIYWCCPSMVFILSDWLYTLRLYLIIALLLLLYTQGSVLGPMLFTMYIKPLSAIIDVHSTIHHSFADDLQLQMSTPPDRISELFHSMQSCICDVKAWATANKLRLNDNKTELMLVTSKRTKHLHNLPSSITMGDMLKFPSNSEEFGFYIRHLTMNSHVSNIAQTCYFELSHLVSIRRFLTSTATATLVSAFVLSRIDYCNSLLFGSTYDAISHLQRI